MRISCVLLIGLAFIFSSCVRAQTVPQAKPPLIEGGALDCPDHLGLRQFHSDTASYQGISIAIWADSRRDAQGCQQTAKLHVVQEGSVRDYDLPDAGNLQFSIVDFSADARNVLLESDGSDSSDGREFRDTSVAIASLSGGSMQWQNAWDLFGWGNCDASVEVQGFTQAGNIVISTGISTQYGHEHPNCVPRTELFEVGADFSTRRVVSHKLNVETHGAVGDTTWRTCKSDPDIVAACFCVHGRLSFFNGGPSARIWRIGTKRMIGVRDDILPGSLGLHMNGFDDEAFGDFYLCPFTREEHGAMQFVCIESAKNLRYAKRQ